MEGPTSGLDNFCGSEVIDHICDECDQGYNFRDVFAFALSLRSKTNERILAPLRNASKDVQNFVEKAHLSLEEVSNDLHRKVSVNLALAKYEKILLQLRFLSQLFSRIGLGLDRDSLDFIKTNYIRVAIDTPHQDGVLSLLQILHSLLTGQRLTIFGLNQPSILILQSELCKEGKMLQLEQLILTLHFQAHFVYKDHPDLPALSSWLADLRTEEIAQFKSSCG